MNHFHSIINEIARGKWMIDPHYAFGYYPLVTKMLSGDASPHESTQGEEYQPLAVIHQPNGPNLYINNYKTLKKADFIIEQGSVLSMPVTGAIMKSDYCGSYGSLTRAAVIKAADNHDSIKSIIIDADSGGGSVYGTETLVDAIRSCTKPIDGLVNDGMAASAMYWVISTCNNIYVTHGTSQVGSIGVYTTYLSLKKAYADMGIAIEDIYSNLSTEKNGKYRIWEETGNSDAVRAELDVLAQHFIDQVNLNRGSKINLEAGDPYKGAMYYADEALAIGLIDGIKSYDELVSEALGTNEVSTENVFQTNIYNMKQYAKVNATLGVDSLEASEDGVYLNETQIATIESTLEANEQAVNQAAASAAEGANARIAELETQLAASNANAASANALINSIASEYELEGDTAEAQAESLRAHIATLESKPGAKPAALAPAVTEEVDQTPNVFENPMYEGLAAEAGVPHVFKK